MALLDGIRFVLFSCYDFDRFLTNCAGNASSNQQGCSLPSDHFCFKGLPPPGRRETQTNQPLSRLRSSKMLGMSARYDLCNRMNVAANVRVVGGLGLDGRPAVCCEN